MSKTPIAVHSENSVIAIVRHENAFKAVELRKHNSSFEILWTKSTTLSDTDWRTFATECGLSSTATTRAKSNRQAVAGFDSAGVALYQFGVPAVGEQETASMVKMQAETMLPLPTEQMELAWRKGRTENGEVTITLAAARKETLQRFVQDVREFKPTEILLNSEGIVKAWRTMFSGNDNRALIVSMDDHNTQVCLTEGGRLINAASIDIGTKDFAELSNGLSFGTDQDIPEQTETTERFAQDIRSILESFGQSAHLPVYVLSDGSTSIEGMVSSLKANGIPATAISTDTRRLTSPNIELKPEQLYEYRVPIGLAALALEMPKDGFNLFGRLYSPTKAEEKTSWYRSTKVAGAIAALMFVAFVIVSYAVDVANEKHLSALETEAGFKEVLQQQALVKDIARQRPDLLQLLSEIGSGENKGILLDSLNFRKGQPVTITGQAEQAEQIYEFQKNLLNKKGINDVNIQNTSKGSDNNKIKFTMTFHYRNYTKKGA